MAQQESVMPTNAIRRGILQGSLGLGLAALFSTPQSAQSKATTSALGFRGIPASRADSVNVPQGYEAHVMIPWGEPVGIAGAPLAPWKSDASSTAQEQALQMGMHHDGMQFYPLPSPKSKPQRGLLVINHEYVDDGLLHPDGAVPWTAQKTAKSQAAHGISVVEIALLHNRWQAVRPSPLARRITATTACQLQGPARGHPMVQTALDPQGHTVLGTLANCASGKTPWGTYLSGEENFNSYFDGPPQPDAHQKRWNLRKKAPNRWAPFDARFDAAHHPNEFNRFGWVVEVDPFDPSSPPIKRTALGRAAHEGAWVATTREQRAVVYSGEDARFEYIYKFISRERIAPGGFQPNRTLLDHGTLYVARFDAGGTGVWLPLVQGEGPLTAANGFQTQGDVVIKARQASDALGGTKMDRPEWMAIDQAHGQVFCALTNNAERGMPGYPGADAANPRAANTMGQIIRWQERGDFDATDFTWNHLVLAGDSTAKRPQAQGNVQGDAFGCPDGLVLDARGILWIQTDISSAAMHKSEFANLGNNQMLACDPTTGEIRRFLTGPIGCEITGATFTTDGKTLFVNIQHPGEGPDAFTKEGDVKRSSTWPDGTRPRSATVAIRRHDGGVIGA
jgi:uncharacterized protein